MASDAEKEDHTPLSHFNVQKLQNLGLDDLQTIEPVTIPGWTSDGSPSPALTSKLFNLLNMDEAPLSASLDPNKTLEETFETWWRTDACVSAKRAEIRQNWGTYIANSNSETSARGEVDKVLELVQFWFHHCRFFFGTLHERQLASMKHGSVTIASARPQNAGHVLPGPVTRYKLTGKGDYLSFAQVSYVRGHVGRWMQYLDNGDPDVVQGNERVMSVMRGLKKIEDVIKADLWPFRFRFVVVEAKSRQQAPSANTLVNRHFSQIVGETFCLIAKLRSISADAQRFTHRNHVHGTNWALSNGKTWTLGTTTVNSATLREIGEVTIMRLPAIELPDGQDQVSGGDSDLALKRLVLLLICWFAWDAQLIADTFLDADAKKARTRQVFISASSN